MIPRKKKKPKKQSEISGSLQVGQEVIIVYWNKRAIIESEEDGLFSMRGENGLYEPHELRPVDKPTINYVSDKRALELQIYEILLEEQLKNKPMCEAKLPGCSIVASEVHHMVGKENLFLIASTFFLSVCRKCHGKATENSRFAIEVGISYPRNGRILVLTDRERELMDTYGVKSKH